MSVFPANLGKVYCHTGPQGSARKPMEGLQVFTDGGVCRSNPSSIGGTWAYIVVHGEDVIAQDAGWFTPSVFGMTEVENNFTETYAIVMALEEMAELKTSGYTLLGDNLNSLRRLNDPENAKMSKVPAEVVARLRAVRKAHPVEIATVLLKGHPSKKHIEAGFKEGKPVSKWNRKMDEECCRQAEIAMASLGLAEKVATEK